MISAELLKAIRYVNVSNNPHDMINFRESEEYYEVTITSTEEGVVIVAYKQEALKYIDEALNLVFDFRKDFSDIVSEEFIRKKLNEIIKNALLQEDPNKNNLIISEVGTFLKNIQEEGIVFFIRVFNLKCSKTYDFGHVKLYPNKTVFVREVSRNYSLGKNQKEGLYKQFEEGERIHSIAEVHISSAEEINAKEKAIYDLDHFLNMLRGFNTGNQIWIEGEAIPILRFYFSYNKSKKILHQRFERLDVKREKIDPFDLDQLYKFNPQLMNKIESVLKKENRTPLENRIVNSLTWLGESVKEEDNIHKLLKMIISLENLLLEKEANKKYLLAERCAFLLSEKFADRMEIKELIEKAYNLRNSIVHEGKTPYIRKRILKDLFWYIRELNIKFLMIDEFASIKDVQNFVEKCKYS